MKIGAHVSIAGGIDQAPGRAKELGCNCLQIFSKNPRGWKARKLTDEEAQNTKRKLKEFELDPLITHITYLVNLATSKEELYEKSLAGLITELSRAGYIGASYLVLHPGKYKDSTLESGIKRIAESINTAFSEVNNNVVLLLENVAGAGSEIGRTFEELKMIIDLVDEQNRVGICFDTCHGFAAGYDLRNGETVDQVLTYFNQVIGIEKLKVIHANDAKAKLGSNLDRHEHIGMGFIGETGFKAMLNHPDIVKNEVPFILETPINDQGDFKSNIMKLKELTQ